MKKGIFTTQKRGIDLNGGRKANILASMAKKASLTLNLDKHDSQPFMGHSIVESDLSASTIATDAFKRSNSHDISTETIRKMVKAEIQESMLLKDSTCRIETLHKSLDNLSKSTICLVDEKTKSLRKEFGDLLKDSQTTMINNMKMFIGIMTKETHQRFSKEFVPLSFVEDIEKQLEYFEDRLDKIERSPLQNSVVRRSAKEIFEQQIENTVNKSLNEMNSLKKMFAQLDEDKNKMASQILQLNKIIADLSLRNAENNTKIVEMTKKASENLQMEIDKVKQTLLENSSKTIRSVKKITSRSLSKSPSPSQQSKQQKENEDTSDSKLPSLSVIDQPEVTSMVMGMSVIDESYRVNSSPYVRKDRQAPVTPTNHNSLLCSGGYSILGDELDCLKIVTQESVEEPDPQPQQKQQQSPQKIAEEIPNEQTQTFITPPQPLPVQLYHIDDEGFLLDDQGQYLQDPKGEFIVLNKEQIDSLKASQLLVTEE